MAGSDPTEDERRKGLDAQIAAARARLEARRQGGGIGDLLAGVNDELDQIANEDIDEAERAMKKIEARLAAERIRIEDDAEEEDR
jgi:hypothetical protein